MVVRMPTARNTVKTISLSCSSLISFTMSSMRNQAAALMMPNTKALDKGGDSLATPGIQEWNGTTDSHNVSPSSNKATAVWARFTASGLCEY